MYDVLIIGAGPAGMTAGIYAKRANLKVAMIEKGAPGGQIVNTAEIENYTGYKRMPGADLAMEMFEHTQDIGVEYIGAEVTQIIDLGKVKEVVTESQTFEAKAIIIASGTLPRKLGVKNEERFASNGISWCAICDGPFYKDKNIAVVGGGNSGVEEATYLATLVKHVTILQDLYYLTADAKAQEILNKMDNVDVLTGVKVLEFVEEEGRLTGVKIQHSEDEETEVLNVDGVFEYIGWLPVTDMVKDLGVTNKYGYIVANEKMETSVAGIFAAGDVRDKQIRQVVTATSDGAIAVQNVLKYLERLE